MRMDTCVTLYLRFQSRAKAFVREGERAQVENSAGAKKGRTWGSGWQRGAAVGTGGATPIPGVVVVSDLVVGRKQRMHTWRSVSCLFIHTSYTSYSESSTLTAVVGEAKDRFFDPKRHPFCNCRKAHSPSTKSLVVHRLWSSRVKRPHRHHPQTRCPDHNFVYCQYSVSHYDIHCAYEGLGITRSARPSTPSTAFCLLASYRSFDSSTRRRHSSSQHVFTSHHPSRHYALILKH